MGGSDAARVGTARLLWLWLQCLASPAPHQEELEAEDEVKLSVLSAISFFLTLPMRALVMGSSFPVAVQSFSLCLQ